MAEIKKQDDFGEDIEIFQRKSFSKKKREEIKERARNADGQVICCECGEEIKEIESFHVAHIRSRGLGGSNEDENLSVAHPHCNLRRNWREESGAIAKAKRIEKKRKGLVKPKGKIKSRGFPPKGTRKVQWWKK